MRAKVSVIIPVYNVEDYLQECLDSVLGQSLQEIEIVLVDDGSTDHSGQICDEYAKQDDRIQVIHTPNGGLSHARNTGIDHAKGEYIALIDSDDWVHPNFLEILLRLITDNNADMAQCSLQAIHDNTEVKRVEQCNAMLYTGEEMLIALYEPYGWKNIVAWNKLYKKSLFDNLRYPVGKIHEDEYITWKLLLKASWVATTTAGLYYYRQREGSIMSKPFNLKRLDAIQAFEERLEMLKEYNFELYLRAVGGYRAHLLVTIDRMERYFPQEKIIIADLIDKKKYCENVLEQNGVNFPYRQAKLFKHFCPGKYIYKLHTDKTIDEIEYNIFKHCADVRKILNEKEKVEQNLDRSIRGKHKLKYKLANLEKEKQKLERHLKNIQTGPSFRIGRFITYLPRKIRGGIKCYREHGLEYTLKRIREKIFG